MQNSLQLSETVFGLGAGIFFIGYFLFEVPCNLVLHRIGARKVITRIMLTWGALSIGTLFVQTPTAFYVLRFLLGAAEAGFAPGIVLYLTYWYPLRRRGQALSLLLMAVPVAGILGGPCSGWILKHMDGLHGWEGWQWMFLLQGLPTLLLGAIVWLRLDDGPATARWLSPADQVVLLRCVAAERVNRLEGSTLALLGSARVWLLALVYFCLVSGVYGVSFWLPAIIKTLGVSDPMDVGLVSAVPWVFAALAMYLNARSADRRLEHRWHVAIPALLGAVGLLVSIAFHGHTLTSLAALTLATAGIMSCLPVFWGLPTAFLGGTAAAAGIAFINSCGNLAGFAAPYAMGLIVDATHSTDLGMQLLAGLMVLGAMAVVRIPRGGSTSGRPRAALPMERA